MAVVSMLVGAALLASNPTSAMDETREATATKVADYAAPAARKRKRVYVHPSHQYPVACEAVRFPRSPLCVGRPYQYGFYNW